VNLRKKYFNLIIVYILAHSYLHIVQINFIVIYIPYTVYHVYYFLQEIATTAYGQRAKMTTAPILSLVKIAFTQIMVN